MFVIVAGAGLIGSQITPMLVENHHDVVVIDIDRDVCEAIHAETGAMAVHGSATDIRVLEEANAPKADAVLCLMRLDADNIACALLAKSLGVPRIIVRMRNPRYEQAYRLGGVTTIVRVADLLLSQLMTEIEQPKVRTIMSLGGGKAKIFAVQIPARARSVGMTIRQITSHRSFPTECAFMAIYRESADNVLIPRGDHVLMEDDTVFLVSTSQLIKQATDFLTRAR